MRSRGARRRRGRGAGVAAVVSRGDGPADHVAFRRAGGEDARGVGIPRHQHLFQSRRHLAEEAHLIAPGAVFGVVVGLQRREALQPQRVECRQRDRRERTICGVGLAPGRFPCERFVQDALAAAARRREVVQQRQLGGLVGEMRPGQRDAVHRPGVQLIQPRVPEVARVLHRFLGGAGHAFLSRQRRRRAFVAHDGGEQGLNLRDGFAGINPLGGDVRRRRNGFAGPIFDKRNRLFHKLSDGF